MSTTYLIAKKIAFSGHKSFSGFMIRLSIITTAVSVAAMIIALAFTNGFQETVSNKVHHFWGSIRVQHYENEKTLIAEESPIQENDTVYQTIKQTPFVSNIEKFATKGVIVEHDKQIEGILLKGIAVTSHNAYSEFITQGKPIQSNYADTSNSLYIKQIVISENLANLLNIKVNDEVNVYVVNKNLLQNVRRKLTVTGIFKTGLEEYDRQFAIVDLNLIRRMNDWDSTTFGGYEVYLNNKQQIDTVVSTINENVSNAWYAKSIVQIYPNVFDWLNVQNLNKSIVIIIMLVVASVNLITCLLILLLERTKMIGILKSLGAKNLFIEKIFAVYALMISVLGILIGAGLGLSLCYLQQRYQFITLPEAFYGISSVQVSIHAYQVCLVMIGTLLISFLTTWLPLLFIKKVSPLQAVRFD